MGGSRLGRDSFPSLVLQLVRPAVSGGNGGGQRREMRRDQHDNPSTLRQRGKLLNAETALCCSLDRGNDLRSRCTNVGAGGLARSGASRAADGGARAGELQQYDRGVGATARRPEGAARGSHAKASATRSAS